MKNTKIIQGLPDAGIEAEFFFQVTDGAERKTESLLFCFYFFLWPCLAMRTAKNFAFFSLFISLSHRNNTSFFSHYKEYLNCCTAESISQWLILLQNPRCLKHCPAFRVPVSVFCLPVTQDTHVIE